MKYYLINTNKKANPEGQDENQMLSEKIVSLYFEGHKENITKLNDGDIVFLYSNEVGIIACGEVNGETIKRSYKGLVRFKDEEFYQKFKSFYQLSNPITVTEMKKMFGVRPRVIKSFNPISEIQGIILFDYILNKIKVLKSA